MSGALTVSALTARIRELLEGNFPETWVVGEVGNLTRARSGHVYLTLKDQDAAISCVIWRSTAARLRHDLDEGMEVLAMGRVVVYPPRGRYQLDIRMIEPRGVGALQAAFEKLKARLGAEGLFDEERKRTIPFLPRQIGIVTSPTGAAVRDILRVLDRRFPGVSVVIWPARVQGEGAAAEIADGIRGLAERGPDVLIVGRGGGSLEDLWAFNEEPVARAIASCPVPVVSAVGHEVDWTIADLVADLRAPTPSAAAELVVPEEVELRARLDASRARLRGAMGARLTTRRERLRTLEGSYGVRGFPDRLLDRSQRLDELGRRLGTGAEGVLGNCREELGGLAARAESLSPLRVLGRGYTLTTLEGAEESIRDASALEAGSRISTRFARGRVLSVVQEVEEEERSDE